MNPHAETIRSTLSRASRRWTNRIRLKRLGYGLWAFALALLTVYVLCSLAFVPHEILRIGILFGIIGFVAVAFWISIAPRSSLVKMALRYERHFPRFKGRLNLSAEIIANSKPEDDWPEFATHALNRSAHHLTRYSVEQVLPLQKTVRLLLSGVGLLIAIVGLYTLGPNPKPAQQLASAWETRGGRGYKFVLSQPQVSVVRGRPFTLTAYLVPVSPRYQTPENVNLVLRTPSGIERHPMTLNDDVWTIELATLEDSCDYWVEGNRVRSPYGQITLVEPLELLETEIKIVAPSYLDKPVQKYSEFSSLVLIEGGELQVQFVWNETPRSAELYFQPDNADEPISLPLVLNRKGIGQGSYRPTKSGTYRLKAISQAGVPFDWTAHVLTITPDSPPFWENLRGFPTKNRRARPSDQLWIRGIAKDDSSLHDVYLEWRLNDGPPKKVPLAELEVGLNQAKIDYVFSLENRGLNGDRLYFRLVLSDGRPLIRSEQHRTRYPHRGWIEILLDESSSPLNEQDALASEIELHANLRDIQKLVTANAQQNEQLIQAIKRNPLYLVEHPERARAINEGIDDTLTLIDNLQHVVEPIFGYAKLRDSLKQARDTLSKLQVGLQPLLRELDRTDSLDFLNEVTQTFAQSGKTLETMVAENQTISRLRLLSAKLENFGLASAKLANETKVNPTPTPDLEGVQNLWNLIWNDGELKGPIQLARAQQLHTLAQTLRDYQQQFLQAHQDLGIALANQRQHFFNDAKTRFENDLQQVQQRYDALEFLARVLRQPTPDIAPLKEAQKHFQEGEIGLSLQKLERVILTLHEFAQVLRVTLNTIDEPRERGQLLLRFQQEILSELDNQTKQKAWNELPITTQERLLEYQATVTHVQKGLKLKVEKTSSAFEILKKGDVPQTRKMIEENIVYLKNAIPALATNEQRTLKVQQEMAALRKEVETYAKMLEVLKRDCTKGNPDDVLERVRQRQLLNGLAQRVATQHERLQNLSVPVKFLSRFEKVLLTLHTLGNDLTDGLYLDAMKSVPLIRKELDAWDAEQDGRKAFDTEITELANKLAELAEKQKATPLENILELLGDYQRVSQGWNLPERGTSIWYFQEMLARAEKELTTNPKDTTSLNEAAKTLRVLADLSQNRLPTSGYLDHLLKILAFTNDTNAKKVVPKFLDEWKALRVGVDRFGIAKKVTDNLEGWLRSGEKWNPALVGDPKKLRETFEKYEDTQLEPDEALGLFAEYLQNTTPKEGKVFITLSESLPLSEPDRQALREACRKLAEAEKNPDPAAAKIALAKIAPLYERACQNWEKIVENAQPRKGFPTESELALLDEIAQSMRLLKLTINGAQESWQRDRACRKLDDGPSDTQRPILTILKNLQSLADRIEPISQTLRELDSDLAEGTKRLVLEIQKAQVANLNLQDLEAERLRVAILKDWQGLLVKFPEKRDPVSSPVGENLWAIQTKFLGCKRCHTEKKWSEASKLWSEIEKLAYRSSGLILGGE